MRSAWVCACALLAGCGFSGDGNPIDPIDAGADRTDAAPGEPDAEEKADAPPNAVCPIGYAPIAGLSTESMYKFVETQRIWIAAEDDCDDDSGPSNRSTHLVVLDDAAERDAVISPTGSALNDQWIGLTDLRAEGTFLYVTNQPSVYFGSPTGNQSDEDCVRLKNNTNHEIRNCDESNRFVCECDNREPNASHFPNPPDGN